MKRKSLSAPATPTSARKKRFRKRSLKRPRLSGQMAALNLARMSRKRKATDNFQRQLNAKKIQKRNSVIVIDSEESEADVSVVEIIDASNSIIELSDDEIGVCSGSLSAACQKGRKPLRAPDWNGNAQLDNKTANDDLLTKVDKPNKGPDVVVDDQTGRYIKRQHPSNPESSTGPSKNAEIYQPLADSSDKKTGLRPVVIDGCNVAFGHGRDRFSSLGLKICVDYFKKLGHEVIAFVPQFRRHHHATTNPELLDIMEKAGTLTFTPSRRQTDGKMIVSYDDRFIVQYADTVGGVIVSKDNYRDLVQENPEWKDTINKRLLMFTWVGDTIMFPKDPLGRGGPNLQDFLKFNA
ncbi:Zc3h12a-like Ribonuclease NYN domain [Nesidiocoris tenuis]|nr:Zc3h12a-like Ribonuclease NYN domain [Nesidiocoris tenuis]